MTFSKVVEIDFHAVAVFALKAAVAGGVAWGVVAAKIEEKADKVDVARLEQRHESEDRVSAQFRAEVIRRLERIEDKVDTKADKPK